MIAASRIRRALGRSLLAGALALAAALSPAAASTLPSGFVETLIANGLTAPTAMAFAPDGRLFVTLQGGSVRVIKGGGLLPVPFVTLGVDSSGERGVIGIAFDPAFATNGYVYLHYTVPGASVHNRVSRFVASGDVAVAGSETAILDLDPLSATNHNGGALHFGPDGKLYMGVGENANAINAQLPVNLLGKMLRINADGTIPTDNPFYVAYGGVNRAIWGEGLRNPFTFAFQPGTGRMLINDVGQSTWEEINEGIAGANYGWPLSEGPTSASGQTGPIYAYGHGTGNFLGCAVSGGAFYNPPVPLFPASYAGKYFFADFCGNWINLLDLAQGNSVASFATGAPSPVDLKVGPDGALYYLSRSGAVYRIGYGNAPPTGTITAPAAGTLYRAGDTIAYAGAATDPEDGTLAASRFTWQVDLYRNDPPASVQPIVPPTAGVTGGSFVVPTTGDASANVLYRITLTVTDSAGLARSAYRDVAPRTATITLATDPPGLPVTLDGVVHASPHSVVGVAGTTRTIGVATPQTAGGATYAFRAWSSGGAATHAITTPPQDTGYTAIFRRMGGG